MPPTAIPVENVEKNTLGFPNGEVRMGFADCLYRHVTHSRQTIQERSVFLNDLFESNKTGYVLA